MPSVVLEFVIMLPVLLLLSTALVISTNYIADSWATLRMQASLNDVARHLGTTIRQLYYSFNDSGATPGIITKASDLPSNIELYPYRADGSIVSAAGPGSMKSLQLTLSLMGRSVAVSSSVPLGLNVNWQSSTLMSTSQTAAIQLQKFANGTVTISFR